MIINSFYVVYLSLIVFKYLFPEPPGILCIEITFPTAQYQVFVREKKLDEFRDKAIQTVCSQTGLVRGRLANVQLHAGSIIFLFDLKPKKTQIDGTCQQAPIGRASLLYILPNVTRFAGFFHCLIQKVFSLVFDIMLSL